MTIHPRAGQTARNQYRVEKRGDLRVNWLFAIAHRLGRWGVLYMS